MLRTQKLEVIFFPLTCSFLITTPHRKHVPIFKMFSLYSYTKRPFSKCRTFIFAQKPRSPMSMPNYLNFRRSPISKCPSFTVSQKVQFPNVLLPYFLEMSLFRMSYCHSCMKSSSFSNFRLHFWTKRPFSNVRYFPNVLLP